MVQIKTRVRNDGSAAAVCTLASSILDRDGNAVAIAESIQELTAGTGYEFVQQVQDS